MQRTLTAVLVLAASVISQGQDNVTIRFSDLRQYEVFEASSLPKSEPEKIARVSGDKVELELKLKRDQDRIYVIDREKNAVASRFLGAARNNIWAVTPSDFVDALRIKVRVTSKGEPVAAASVQLDDSRRIQEQLIDPASQGTATFYFVKCDELKVTVKYRSGGKQADPVRQSFTLNAERDVAEPTFEVAVPLPTETVSAESKSDSKQATSGSTEKSPPTSEAKSGSTSGSNPLGNLLSTLVGLGIIGGAGYAAYRYFKKNPDGVKSALEKLGADIPNAAQPDPVVAPTSPAAPAPQPQILLDPVAIDDPIVAPSPATSGIPTLLGTDGTTTTLEEGATTVGREGAVGLLVAHETVSRNHAIIERSGTNITIQDLGSTNGTWVNNVQIQGPTPLHHGDSVRFGAVEFRVRL